MMDDLHFLDHNLRLTHADLVELQSCAMQNQKLEAFSKDTIAIWTDVDEILGQSSSSEISESIVKLHQTQCAETVEQTNEIEQLLNTDALEISFKSNESFESLNVQLNSSNTEEISENGIKNKNKSRIDINKLKVIDCILGVNVSRKLHAERIITHCIDYNHIMACKI